MPEPSSSIPALDLERLPQVVFRATLAGEFTYVNACGRAWFGLAEDLSGRPFSSRLRNGALWETLQTTLRACGFVKEIDLDCLSGEGQYAPVRFTAALSEANPPELTCTLFDLSEIRRFEGILIASRDKLRIVFDAISDPILGVDRSFRIVSANLAVSAWLGKPITEVIGQKCLGVCSSRCPRHSEDTESAPCVLIEVFQSASPAEMEKEVILPGGRRGWFSLYAFPISDANGQVSQAALIFKNITRRREAQKRIERLNQRFKRALIGLRDKNHALKNALRQLKETQAFLLQSEKMASIGQLAAGVAHEINNPVGFVTSNLNTLREYTSDLTELVSLYRDLEKAVEPLSFTSPECKHRLETVATKREAMDLDFVLGDIAELIDQSRDGTKRVQKIVADLKEFSHIDQAELKPVNINACLESTLNIVWNELKYKAAVQKHLGDPPLLLGYPQQLNQVFMNLLVNAAQAIERHGDITITTRAVASPRPGAEITIEDTGKGIAREHMSRIFDPFFTTKPVGKGTGLGLNISYKIVQRHKGTIQVDSVLGQGTKFTIFLPRLEEEDFHQDDGDNAVAVIGPPPGPDISRIVHG